MPLTGKGEKIMGAMQHRYGPKKAERVFYASRNAGRITGVDAGSMKRRALAQALRAKK